MNMKVPDGTKMSWACFTKGYSGELKPVGTEPNSLLGVRFIRHQQNARMVCRHGRFREMEALSYQKGGCIHRFWLTTANLKTVPLWPGPFGAATRGLNGFGPKKFQRIWILAKMRALRKGVLCKCSNAKIFDHKVTRCCPHSRVFKTKKI